MSHKPDAPPPVIQARVRAPHVQAAIVRAAQAKLPEKPPSQGLIQQVPGPAPNRPSQAAHVQRALAAVQASRPGPPPPAAVPKQPAQAPAAPRMAVAARASQAKLPEPARRPGSSAIQCAREDDDDFPPLSAAAAPISRAEGKRLAADSKAELSLNDPATWWAFFGLTDSHAEAKTLGIDNYDSIGGHAVHVTLYKVNSRPVFFLRLTEDQILDQLLGSEQDAKAVPRKGIHVTLENSALGRPKCFRGGVCVPAGLAAATRTALEGDLARFLDSARTAIRHNLDSAMTASRHKKGLEGPLDLRPIHEW